MFAFLMVLLWVILTFLKENPLVLLLKANCKRFFYEVQIVLCRNFNVFFVRSNFNSV